MRRLFKSILPLLALALIAAVGLIASLLPGTSSAAGPGPRPAASPSEIRLTSPNGRYSIVLTARDTGAFLVAQSADGRVSEITVNHRDSGFELFRDGVKPLCSVGAGKGYDPGLFTWPGYGETPRAFCVGPACSRPDGPSPRPAPCPARSSATRAELRDLARTVHAIVLETFESLDEPDRDPESLIDAIEDLDEMIDDLAGTGRCPDGCGCPDCGCDAGP